MPQEATIRMVHDWKRTATAPLQNALQVSRDFFKKDMDSTCHQVLFFMAQSAGKITPRAKGYRSVSPDVRFRHLLKASQYKAMRMAGKDLTGYYKFHAFRLRQGGKPPKEIFGNNESRLKKIPHKGLASRSWMWPLGGRVAKGDGVAVNATELFKLNSAVGTGYVLRDRLEYILAILPAGWQEDVANKAIRRIMGHAWNVLRSRFHRALRAA